MSIAYRRHPDRDVCSFSHLTIINRKDKAFTKVCRAIPKEVLINSALSL